MKDRTQGISLFWHFLRWEVCFAVMCWVASLTAAVQVHALESNPELVRFNAPFSSPFRVDSNYPFHVVNQEGEHLFILNKTAWAYFGCDNPAGVLERAKSLGCNMLRVALEGRPYYDVLKIELWPFGGTRENPQWHSFNEQYWREVEERVRLAGEKGIGLDLVLYMSLHPGKDDIERQKPYWNKIIATLAKYANIFCWEIANEYVANEEFQDACGEYFKRHDPFGRPVCTSDGTTDDAVWPEKSWMDLAINHSCTSSTPRHDLERWYLAVARNTRSHGKPAFCNESGREKRHRNDDGVHRRKQAWLWCTAGGFWTWHSWDGCEGINDLSYRAPGEEYLRPLADFYRAVPFWRLRPNYTACVCVDGHVVQTALATPDRDLVVAYFCTRETGATVKGAKAELRLPNGTYRASFIRPADGQLMREEQVNSKGLGTTVPLVLDSFLDDLVIKIERTGEQARTLIPGTE